MKTLKQIIFAGATMLAGATLTTSCGLDLEPIDYYGSGSYWKTEAHVSSYMDGLHSNLRSASWQHFITFGELRGGIYRSGVGSDGMTLAGGNIVLQNFDADHTGVSKFGDIYGKITNCNLFIARAPGVQMDETKRNYYLAMAYGLRAFYYFDLYRIYGGVPLRTGVEVIDGELDPNKLYKERAKASEVMALIKEDLKKSLELFGDNKAFNVNGKNSKKYWNKAATECLAAEVYLWNAKVTTGDQQATPSDISVAKTHLTSVMNNYGLSLRPTFEGVFDAKSGKANSEVIMAIEYKEGEATNSFGYYTYSLDTGAAKNKFNKNGEIFGDPLGLKKGFTQQYEYKNEVYYQFDEEDTRLDATFLGSFLKKNAAGEVDNENGVLTLDGIHTKKQCGYINSTGDRIWCSDMILYRLPWVYLTLAEIANYEGNSADVARYINLVRERAYGENWNAATYGYTAGDFTQNELAILHEKDKEFVQEGQRWWDLRRMTLTKGGKHLVFCSEASVGQAEPILNESTEAHKVLWPIDKTLMASEAVVEQTPGY